jgi:hypothetical protein
MGIPKMKTITLCLLAMLFAGCTSTTVEMGKLRVHRISFGQSVNVHAGYDSNQMPFIIYGNDGGKATAQGIATGIVLLK